MTKYITIRLTEDQQTMLVGLMWSAVLNDEHPQTRAYKQRLLAKIDRAKTV